MENEVQQNTAQSSAGARHLYRSRRQRMIGGICGGLAEYFEIDPTIVRIAMIVLALVGGWGIIAYVIGLIIIPEHPIEEEGHQAEQKKEEKNGRTTWGVVLILAGLIFLLHNYGLFPWSMWRSWSAWRFLWPVLIITLGVLLLITRSACRNDRQAEVTDSQNHAERRLMRSRKDRMVGGVCGGLARHFSLDPTLVRLLWAFGTILSHGVGILAYIIMLIVVPEEVVLATDSSGSKGQP